MRIGRNREWTGELVEDLLSFGGDGDDMTVINAIVGPHPQTEELLPITTALYQTHMKFSKLEQGYILLLYSANSLFPI